MHQSGSGVFAWLVSTYETINLIYCATKLEGCVCMVGLYPFVDLIDFCATKGDRCVCMVSLYLWDYYFFWCATNLKNVGWCVCMFGLYL